MSSFRPGISEAIYTATLSSENHSVAFCVVCLHKDSILTSLTKEVVVLTAKRASLVKTKTAQSSPKKFSLCDTSDLLLEINCETFQSLQY